MRTRKKDEHYYRNVLGVQPGATQKEIRQAYLSCVKYYHPDNYEIGSLAWENANKRLVEFNEAYAYLKSGLHTPPPQKRAHEKRTHRTGKKPAAKMSPLTAEMLQEIFRSEERGVTEKYMRLARAVLGKYLALLAERSTLVFGAKLLALLLILAMLLAMMGVTPDRIAARLAEYGSAPQKLLYFTS